MSWRERILQGTWRVDAEEGLVWRVAISFCDRIVKRELESR